jgi:DNA polymerase sigma
LHRQDRRCDAVGIEISLQNIGNLVGQVFDSITIVFQEFIAFPGKGFDYQHLGVGYSSSVVPLSIAKKVAGLFRILDESKNSKTV